MFPQQSSCACDPTTRVSSASSSVNDQGNNGSTSGTVLVQVGARWASDTGWSYSHQEYVDESTHVMQSAQEFGAHARVCGMILVANRYVFAPNDSYYVVISSRMCTVLPHPLVFRCSHHVSCHRRRSWWLF